MSHFLQNFWKKIFLLYFIIWPSFYVWQLSLTNFYVLLLATLGNMCILIIPVYDIINFGINLSFLIMSFSWGPKKVRTFEKSYKRKVL